MTHIAITRIALKPGNNQRMQEAVQELLEARRPLLGGDLRSMHVVRSANSDEYALISVWASTEADARHENDTAERQAAERIGPVVAVAPVEFAGEVIAGL
ncbi:MAG: antibiotic biosynthesis monooxygenase [Chloroflexi bacterium]|nr:antibiotic biosynthesis monooxygenase [Chloroflexota bacterium]